MNSCFMPNCKFHAKSQLSHFSKLRSTASKHIHGPSKEENKFLKQHFFEAQIDWERRAEESPGALVDKLSSKMDELDKALASQEGILARWHFALWLFTILVEVVPFFAQVLTQPVHASSNSAPAEEPFVLSSNS